jgi:hypothetical protein
MPAPVDVGGFVGEPKRRFTAYPAGKSGCTSAVRLALSRSAFPMSVSIRTALLKFRQAYDPRNRQTNTQVWQQLFDSYPGAVRARLGTLTRQYKVLRGSELIALGIRNCNEPRTNEPRTMVASSAACRPVVTAVPDTQKPLFAGLIDKLMSVFGGFC